MPEQFKNPPLWLLHQTILGGGQRLEKAREKWKEPVVITRPSYTSRNPPRWFDKGTGKTMTLEGNKVVEYKGGEFAIIPTPKTAAQGNLPKSEYFQWIGARVPVSGFARCRACNYTAWGELQRNLHKNGCGKILFDAYVKLRLDKHRPTGQYLCVCCSRATHRLVWGVPMCAGDCEDFWKFGGAQAIDDARVPTALKDALALVRVSGVTK